MSAANYTFDGGMTLTPFGQIWFRSLLSGINRLQPVSLQLGQYEWGERLFQRVQQPVITLPANAQSQLINSGSQQYTEAGLLNESGQTIAVCKIDVSLNNQPGLSESLRWRVLTHPGTSRLSQPVTQDAFQDSVCKIVNGEMECADDATPSPAYDLSTEDDDEWAQAPVGISDVNDLFDRAKPDESSDPDASGPLATLKPSDSISTNINMPARWGHRVHAGWKLPKTRLYLGAEPGFYLHILKTTRFTNA